MNNTNYQLQINASFWLLKTILPTEYLTHDAVNIINCAVDYIKKLKDEVEKVENAQELLTDAFTSHNGDNLKCENVKEEIHILEFLDDDDEIHLLEDLGMDTRSKHLKELHIHSSTFSDKHEYTLASGAKVRRPGNGFIRFSNEKRKELAIMFPKYENREVSTLLGRMWKKMSPKEKKPYQDKFKEEMSKLREEHPDWNYAGSRSKCQLPKSEEDKILSQRLRPRHVTEFTTFKSECLLTRQTKTSKKRGGKKINKKNRAPMVLWIECDLCKKWRKLPPNTDQTSLPSKWCCYMNPNQMFNSCSISEEPDD